MALSKTVTLPLIPLAKGTVLLPGIVLRIPVSGDRADIPALLSDLYSRGASKTQSQRLDHVHVACVPWSSPRLSNHGQKLIAGTDSLPAPKERSHASSGTPTKADLFGYGVAAKITGVEGRGTGEFSLLVEGISRIRIDQILQEKPFFEAKVTYQYDEGMGEIHIGTGGVLMLASYLPRRCGNARTLRQPQAALS